MSVDSLDLDTLDPAEPVGGEDWHDLPVTFRNCYIKGIWVATRTYTKRFTFENCYIEKANFFCCYLVGGITIDRCTFKDDMFLLMGGGHNAPEEPVVIKDTVFCGFVDMQDALFMGPVTISGCNFVAGTNLLGNLGQSDSVHFEVPPKITDNKGKLDLDGSLFTWKGTPVPNTNIRAQEEIPLSNPLIRHPGWSPVVSAVGFVFFLALGLVCGIGSVMVLVGSASDFPRLFGLIMLPAAAFFLYMTVVGWNLFRFRKASIEVDEVSEIVKVIRKGKTTSYRFDEVSFAATNWLQVISLFDRRTRRRMAMFDYQFKNVPPLVVWSRRHLSKHSSAF